MINFSRHYTAEQIIKATADYDSVSFDVFDTLVKRCVAVPSDVFVRTAKDYCVNYGMGGGHTLIDPVKFKQDRQNAEHLAHTKLTSREEVSLDEIYDNLPEEYSHCKDKLKALEIEREIKCCRANPVMKQVYDWCREHNKRILIISDMYLPVNAVREILSVCGYDGYERLYLSSDVGLKKSSGRLFRFAIQDSGINTKRHIHIGDAWRGDYLRALQAGISAYKIVRHPVRSKYAKTMGLKREHRAQYEKYQRVINNHVAPDWDEYYQYGFEVVGLMLYGLCCWLHERFTENKHDKVFFLSRDGYLMQEAYNKLFGERAVKNSYLYVSRNSLLMPRIWINPSLDNILDFVTTFEYLDLNQLCDILDIDTAKVYDVWEKCGLGRNESMPKKQFIHDERVNAFFEHFKGEIVMKSREKFSVLTEYLKQEGFYGNVAVVDIGWAGSMQRFLGECLKQANIDVQIYGYYLSMTPHIAVNASEAEGYIPVKLNPKLSCTALIEYPFTKIAGSTETYALKEDGTVIPVLSDYEFAGTEDENYTQQVQNGTMHFINLINEGYGAEHIDYSLSYAKMRKVTKSPSLRETELLGDIRSVNHGRKKYLAKPDSFMHYILHPGKFKTDFIESGWKMGFMKRLFKLPIPYDSLLRIARSILEKRYS